MLKAMSDTQSGSEAAFARMGLEKPSGLKQRLMRRLLDYALGRTIRG